MEWEEDFEDKSGLDENSTKEELLKNLVELLKKDKSYYEMWHHTFCKTVKDEILLAWKCLPPELNRYLINAIAERAATKFIDELYKSNRLNSKIEKLR